MLIKSLLRPLSLAIAVAVSSAAWAAPQQAPFEAAKQENEAFLATLKELVHIESGSKDLEGLDQIANLVADKFKQLGAKVEILRPTDIYRLDDTPEKLGPIVHAQFKGKGTSKIMLIAHMDTVYLKGMIKDQPFRIEGDRAYGLGISDDKQGVATIIHTLSLLQKLGYDNYGSIDVLINSDEEISSPAARNTITELGADQDIVLSFEGGGTDGSLRLATSGIGAAYLSVQGKASHAGAKPEDGVNALYELAHQLLQMKNLSKPEQGLKLNWTVAQAGTNRNVIPAQAVAQADARALRVEDFVALEKAMREKIAKPLLKDSKVELKFEVRRPPLEATEKSIALGKLAQGIYKNELDLDMKVMEVATGGGTDAAFAALKSRGAVIEGLGLSGYGAHSNDAEYVQLDTITPRLYLATRLIMAASEGELNK